MSMIHLSLKHGRSLSEAQKILEQTAQEMQSKFGMFVQQMQWSTDRHAVQATGPGYQVDLRVDAEVVHIEGDIPILGRLLGSPLLAGLKALVEKRFHKQLKEQH
jgi:hypothetical protein